MGLSFLHPFAFRSFCWMVGLAVLYKCEKILVLNQRPDNIWKGFSEILQIYLTYLPEFGLSKGWSAIKYWFHNFLAGFVRFSTISQCFGLDSFDLMSKNISFDVIEALDLSLNAAIWVPVSLVVGIGSGLYIYSKVLKQHPQQPRVVDSNSIVSVLSAKSQVIAHKGAALDGPENTLGAIRKVIFISCFTCICWLKLLYFTLKL